MTSIGKVPSGVRHGRLKRPHALSRLIAIVAASLAVLLVSGTTVAAVAVWSIASSVKPGIHLVQLPGMSAEPVPQVGAIDGAVNLVLTGTDTRTGQGGAYSSATELAGSSGAGNNDVTILIHISKDHRSAAVVSFPRDMIIPIPDCPAPGGGIRYATSAAMINTTLSRGGLSCVVLTVESLTGLHVPYAAEISFDGVTAMSDAVGGVSVCLASPINDDNTNPALHLSAGIHTIVGQTALSFLRTRHGIADGSDLARISNQQLFMSALARKITSGGVLSNPLTMYSLAKAAVTHMTLSDTLTSPVTMVAIGEALKNIGLSNIVFLQYPTVGDPVNPNRVIPSSYAAAVLTAALRADRPLKLTGALGRAAVPQPGAQPAGVATPTPVASGTRSSTSTPTSTPSPTPKQAPAVLLPSTITGQTAAQQTCTKGNG